MKFFEFLPLELRIQENNEATWEYTEEPHSSRRKEILQKHPEIKKLMGYDPSILYIVIVEVCFQIYLCWMLKEASWLTVMVLTYVISAVINHSLGIAIHELAHNLAFGHSRPILNRLLSLWCNLPFIIPFAISHKKYHLDHHKFLGEETLDIDIPTRFEAKFFRTSVTKLIWLFLHPIWFCVRPFVKSPKPLTNWEVINFIVQVLFSLGIYYFIGFKSLFYLFMGTYFTLGFHPVAGHFISEHYLFFGGQATYSYYGSLNSVLFNAGYHVEHHDFPYIPYRRLPLVKKFAPEYYDDLPHHTSLCRVLWDFVFDPNMGPQSRGIGYKKNKL